MKPSMALLAAATLRLANVLTVAALTIAAGVAAASGITVTADGAVHVTELVVPPSPMLSPRGSAYLIRHLQQMQRLHSAAARDGEANGLARELARQRVLFPVRKQSAVIGGVHVFAYTPREGVSAGNRRRVLINLHGGGFAGCWPVCAELESLPIASLGRFRVVSVDYREGPRYHYPAASEDVAAVYRALLKSYRPQDIGIYGCSAGGLLTAMAVAWFQRHGLPRPGAIGIFCAGGAAPGARGWSGDSSYVGMALGEASAVPLLGRPPSGYLAGVDPDDPLLSPVDFPQVLARFPPTLVVTGSRDLAMSSAIYMNEQLSELGVPTELHVWDGMFHGFFYDADVPESRACYRMVVRFFERQLGTD